MNSYYWKFHLPPFLSNLFFAHKWRITFAFPPINIVTYCFIHGFFSIFQTPNLHVKITHKLLIVKTKQFFVILYLGVSKFFLFLILVFLNTRLNMSVYVLEILIIDSQIWYLTFIKNENPKRKVLVRFAWIKIVAIFLFMNCW